MDISVDVMNVMYTLQNRTFIRPSRGKGLQNSYLGPGKFSCYVETFPYFLS